MVCSKALTIAVGAFLAVTSFAQQWTGDKIYVSSSGGVYTTTKCTLSVPAGAVPATQRLSFLPPIFAPVSTRVVPETSFTVGPPVGFLKPVSMAVGYDPSLIPSGCTESQLHLFVVEGHRWILVPGSSVDSTNHVVTGSITRTGVYGVLAASGNQTTDGTALILDRTTGNPNITRITPGSSQREVVGQLKGGNDNWELSPARNAIFRGVKQPNGLFDIICYNVDGSDPIKLTHGQLGDVTGAVVSLDGLSVVLGSKIGGVYGLYRLNSDLSFTRILRTGISNGPSSNAACTRLAFADGTTAKICSLTGTVVATLTLQGNAESLALSPDGTKLAYRTDTNGDVYVANVSTGVSTLVESYSNGYWWSPDSSSLLLAKYSLSYAELKVLILATSTTISVAKLPVDGNFQDNPFTVIWK